MSLKKIVASAGLAAGALAAMAGTASASPLPQVDDSIKQVSDLAGSAGISTLHNTGGGVSMVHDGTEVIGG
ncbi:hypothetical protein [Lentzea flava]|uniref:Secreted protein n=1 Tax=Lentzea flava TaxID=103732 RepID=A0ABQ2UCG1_9PSEU|nr:hypothetical protein [Lentzea flava]MCP2197647.1 hypothetical protein [Lentzea flava]GGU21169.1 hypothetical protein GCM10010178_11720 [Lentzea flava]